MSLTTSLQIGRSALGASQLAIQVAGNNVANAATPGYSRQVVGLSPTRDVQAGNLFLGRGVQVSSIRRQVDAALQSRLQAGISQQSLASTNLELASALEATLGSLTETDVESQLSRFFSAWSELANAPTDAARRGLVVQQGVGLASYLRETRAALVQLRGQVDTNLASAVTAADDLLTRVAALNTEIVNTDGASGNANALRDQRDQVIAQLAELLDITTIEQASGSLDVLVGSTPLVLAGGSRGIRLAVEASSSTTSVRVLTRDNEEELTIASGRIGSLLDNRTTLVDDTLGRLDTLASQIIFQVNRAHSVGYGTTPLTGATATRSIRSTDHTLAFNDPANETFASLPFGPVSGSFLVTVTNAATGASAQRRITIDLDGITNAGAQGFADDTSLSSLAAQLAGVPNLSASIDGNGRLVIGAGAGYRVAFGDDSSGILATLGVNTYFTGTDARDIGVRPELASTPGLLAAGRVEGGQPVDNAAARTIAALSTAGVPALNGSSIGGFWTDAMTAIATRTGAAKTSLDAATVVKENLEAQRASISGVNIDEEAINLLSYQRQYQAAARFISAVDELTQTLLSIAR